MRIDQNMCFIRVYTHRRHTGIPTCRVVLSLSIVPLSLHGGHLCRWNTQSLLLLEEIAGKYDEPFVTDDHLDTAHPEETLLSTRSDETYRKTSKLYDWNVSTGGGRWLMLACHALLANFFFFGVWTSKIHRRWICWNNRTADLIVNHHSRTRVDKDYISHQEM